MIRVAWKKPVTVPLGRKGGKKKTEAHAAIVKGHTNRFVLYQSAAKRIPTYWTLWDQETDTQHFLFGDGLADAKAHARDRIREILT